MSDREKQWDGTIDFKRPEVLVPALFTACAGMLAGVVAVKEADKEGLVTQTRATRSIQQEIDGISYQLRELAHNQQKMSLEDMTKALATLQQTLDKQRRAIHERLAPRIQSESLEPLDVLQKEIDSMAGQMAPSRMNANRPQ